MIVQLHFFIFGRGCGPSRVENCPNADNINKRINLPKYATLKDYTEEGAVLGRYLDKSLEVSWNDFTTKTRGEVYQNKLIQYTDTNAQRNLFFGGLLLALMLSWILTHYYYNRAKSDNKKEILFLNKKFNKLIEDKHKIMIATIKPANLMINKNSKFLYGIINQNSAKNDLICLKINKLSELIRRTELGIKKLLKKSKSGNGKNKSRATRKQKPK